MRPIVPTAASRRKCTRGVQLRPLHFQIEELLDRLPFADYGKLAIAQHQLGHERAAVVVRRHRRAIGPRVAYDRQVAHLGQGQLAESDEPTVVLGEDVARFTQRTGNRDRADGPSRRGPGCGDEGNVVVAAVEHGAGELAEASVEQHEVILGHLFDRALTACLLLSVPSVVWDVVVGTSTKRIPRYMRAAAIPVRLPIAPPPKAMSSEAFEAFFASKRSHSGGESGGAESGAHAQAG
jgi:hypothetical protein